MANSLSHNGALDISKIAGNGSDELKQLLGDIGEFFHTRRAAGMSTSGFGEAIQRRLRVTEISINKKAEEERKTEARVVMEIEVHEDMLNGGGNIHGGCSAFLVDVCSSITLIAMVKEIQGTLVASVSQSLNLVYHSPAQLGDTLRIVNTTLTVGARAHSVRTERCRSDLILTIPKAMSDSFSNDSGFDISKIAGNCSEETKQLLGNIRTFLRFGGKEGTTQFGDAIQSRLRVTEMTVNKKVEEENKLEAKVVMEIEVQEDMLNPGGNVHGGCSAFLVDVCSSISLYAMILSTQGTMYMTVTQTLDSVYHSPAQPGDTLRIVNITLTLGARSHSARTEIWNVTKHRLVASGTHVKMVPSPLHVEPKL
ncbi:hypothetical protein CVT25_007448 [Psilocybe cyanescens]|uniref:Thioesterase domain-containing protein n=1 Tax=Psilocybe cyanescens TaxID=93625 RepID=A0A409XVP5_PSICY|nr:hypothetical protein CVT25_007448 [Psilocybe cyanescens]